MSLAERELDAAIKAAKLAGNYIVKNHSSKKKVIRKSLNEMVTESDIKSQSIIKDSLSKSFPEYDIISEEEETKEITRGNFWIIDPIDGTHNFISGLKLEQGERVIFPLVLLCLSSNVNHLSKSRHRADIMNVLPWL